MMQISKKYRCIISLLWVLSSGYASGFTFMGVSRNRGKTPISHPKSWSFWVGFNPWVCWGFTHHFWKHPYGSFLKWWYPQIIHFNRDFHYFHHPFWGKHPSFRKHPFMFHLGSWDQVMDTSWWSFCSSITRWWKYIGLGLFHCRCCQDCFGYTVSWVWTKRYLNVFFGEVGSMLFIVFFIGIGLVNVC